MCELAKELPVIGNCRYDNEYFYMGKTSMDLIEHTAIWVKGEVLQGRIMIVTGMALCLAGAAIFTSDNTVLKGTLPPLILVILALCGYGGYQVISRPAHTGKLTEPYRSNPHQTIKNAYTKAQNDDKTYSLLKKVWITLALLSAASFFFFSSEYVNGLSLGFAGFFLGGLVIDSFLHQRLTVYMKALENLLT